MLPILGVLPPRKTHKLVKSPPIPSASHHMQGLYGVTTTLTCTGLLHYRSETDNPGYTYEHDTVGEKCG